MRFEPAQFVYIAVGCVRMFPYNYKLEIVLELKTFEIVFYFRAK